MNILWAGTRWHNTTRPLYLTPIQKTLMGCLIAMDPLDARLLIGNALLTKAIRRLVSSPKVLRLENVSYMLIFPRS